VKEDEWAETNELVLKRAGTVMLTDQMQWFEDDYVKLEPLGEPGTFGMAFKCHKKGKPDQLFAVKQINKAKFYFTETKGVLQNMKNEIQIMNVLKQHEYICTLHETYEDRNYIFLVLDFLCGGELYAKIEENEELPEEQAREITKQMLEAVRFMQEQHIAHLDLKPDNILFASKETSSKIKIIDFGEARIVKEDEKLNQKIGTPYYMAPEIINGVPYDAFAADMWSCGVIIFCMLFGFVPFHAEEESEIFEKIKQGFKAEVCDGYGAFFPADIPISAPAQDMIGGLLSTDPVTRYTVSDCLKHAWIVGQIQPPSQPKVVKSEADKLQQRSTKKLFLVHEDPISFSEGEDLDDVDGKDEDEDYVQISAPQNAILKRGYLKKEGKLFKSWKKRYFILENNGVVSYYPSHHEVAKPIHQFSIANAKIMSSSKIKHALIVITPLRNWKLICSNDAQRNEWMAAFAKAAKQESHSINATGNKAIGSPRSGALRVDGQQMRRIRQSFDVSGGDQMGGSFGLYAGSMLARDAKTNEKIENEIERQMQEMMNDLELPEKARANLIKLDNKRKIEMIQQHKFQKLREKARNKQQAQAHSVQNNNHNADTHTASPSKTNGHAPSQPQISQPAHEHGMSLTSASRTFSGSVSLVQPNMMETLKRKRTSAANSQFGDKHERIMTHLVNGVRSRLQIIETDHTVMQCIRECFHVEEKIDLNSSSNSNTDADAAHVHVEEDGTVLARASSLGASNGMMAPSSLQKSRTIHLGKSMREQLNSEKKYVCRHVQNVSYSTLMEAIEFMLKEQWQKEHSKRMYETLVKRISIAHKAKMFSIGADRRDRTHYFKKYANCFVGNEGIDWLVAAKFVKNSDDKRERAKDFGNSLITKGFMKHVVGDHKFKDEKLFYSFDDALIDKHCLLELAATAKHAQPTPHQLPQSYTDTDADNNYKE